MKQRLSLTARLSLTLAALVCAVMLVVGFALYQKLAEQLSVRDDAALLTRVEQIRTLLLNEDALQLIHHKPDLFTNMLGNSESLLVVRFANQPPLINVNPGHSPVPDMSLVAADQPITLAQVQHSQAADGTPFIAVAAWAKTLNGDQPLQIISGRLMAERTHMLANYRQQIAIVIALATLLTALAAWLLTKRGLWPLKLLAQETASISVRQLSRRISVKQAPAELSELIQTFNQMLDRLEINFRQLSQVSADMAHDLRTPISVLLGQTEVAMAQPRSNEYYRTLLGSNFEELIRLSKMIDNMLFLAKAEDASQAIHRQHLPLQQEFARLADYFEGLAEERQLQLHFQAQGSLWADADLLRRALANLLANAIRYADAGSQIDIIAEAVAGGVRIQVKNQGPDIPPEQQQRLFDRFWRADASRQAANGNGLGLSIVRSIMALHQGRCELSSEQHQTCFSLYFPGMQ